MYVYFNIFPLFNILLGSAYISSYVKLNSSMGFC